MTDEDRVRRAVGRIVRHESATDDDAELVAFAWLAEHPPDDAEPVTAEWLKALGVIDNGDLTFSVCKVGGLEVVWYPGGTSGWSGGVLTLYLTPQRGVVAYLVGQPTRGGVRRLCAALGVPLTERPPDRG